MVRRRGATRHSRFCTCSPFCSARKKEAEAIEKQAEKDSNVRQESIMRIKEEADAARLRMLVRNA